MIRPEAASTTMTAAGIWRTTSCRPMPMIASGLETVTAKLILEAEGDQTLDLWRTTARLRWVERPRTRHRTRSRHAAHGRVSEITHEMGATVPQHCDQADVPGPPPNPMTSTDPDATGPDAGDARGPPGIYSIGAVA